MGINCGIIGLPNVGKSTIFNALTSSGVAAANYPFCTIEPNTGVVPVPDSRLDVLAGMLNSAQIIPTTVEFVDIAGLVKGASEGAGLGNQFLGHIRAVDALAHVIRCFDDENVTHVEGSVSPRRDAEVIETELLLSDLSSVDKRLDKMRRLAKGGDKLLKAQVDALEYAQKKLGEGISLRKVPLNDFPPEVTWASFDLLTAKPLMYVANVQEDMASAPPTASAPGYLGQLVQLADEQNCNVIVICGTVESEISQLAATDRKEFLESIGLKSSGLERLAAEGYRLLELLTFFTVGPKETRAWTLRKGSNAVDGAGAIHTDFAKGFIRAEVISYSDYVNCGGEQGAKEKGLLRLEGKAYVMQDGDVVHFRFNV